MSELTASLGTFAAELGMTRDVLRRVLAEAAVTPVANKSGRARYALRDVYAAVVRERQPQAAAPHARIAEIKAAMLEDELRKRRGELVVASEVRLRVSRLVKVVVEAFDLAPDQLEHSADLTPKQLGELERYFNERREELYRRVTEGAFDGQANAGGDRCAVRDREGGVATNGDGRLRGSGGAAGSVPP